MGDGFPFLDIILFALVAGFLILRLRSVLGRRDGHQSRAPDPFAPTPKGGRPDDKVVRLPDRADRPADFGQTPPAEAGASEVKGSLEFGLRQVGTADPHFDINEFLSGARIAFEMVLNAFAAGDTEQLKPLLSPEVFGNFNQSIAERLANHQRYEVKLVSIKSVEPIEAYMAGRTAHVSVKFVSEQITTLYDSAGTIVDGSPTEVIEVTDCWTFARDTHSPDPNWTLVATGTAE